MSPRGSCIAFLKGETEKKKKKNKNGRSLGELQGDTTIF
jgi:hypothetical protein